MTQFTSVVIGNESLLVECSEKLLARGHGIAAVVTQNDVVADWAKGKGHVQADWIATYRNACRTWIKEKMPQAQSGHTIKEITLD